ncbi:LysR family transcriptional regulator [Nocardia sp. NPDC023988]|uniref:LysR family transcriptional regulator n=1 Tax=unclassified Nocardia TaxID=2637762 RepID=UPI00340BE5AB
MNWQEQETFLVLAEELHFGRAAQRLTVSRARVSQMIHTVERRIGAPLFERTSRRVSLTPLGTQLRDALAPHHHGILAALARAADSAGAAEVLRVGFTHPLGSEMLMAAATAFRAERPACTVELREVQLSDRFGQLRRRELDLVFPEYPAVEPDLVSGPVLLRDAKVLVVPTSHPLATRTSVSVVDLADETLLTARGLAGYFLDHHFPTHTPSGRPIHRSMTMPYWQEVMVQVAAGNGIALAAAQAGHFYPRPRLVYLPFDDLPPIEYGLVWRASGLSNAGTAFVRAVTETARASAEAVTASDEPDAPNR